MAKKIYIDVDDIQTPICDVDSQETVISWSRSDNIATIYTSDPTMVTRLKNLMKEDPSYRCYVYNSENIQRPTSYHFECHKSLVSLRRKTERRELTDVERSDIAKRLRKIN